MTRAEAIKQVLENLRVIDSFSEPAAEDALAVGKRLDQERDRLLELGLAWWEADDIPGSVAGPFCALVAEASQNIFGKAFDASGAESRIAAMKSSAARPTVKAEYF